MPKLQLSLAFALESSEAGSFHRIYGPLFHRWLPDGRKDAIRLTADGDPLQIDVWFERRAKKTTGGLLAWDPRATEFDEGVMARQGVLDGGYLFGEILFEISDEEYQAISANAVPTSSGDKTQVIEDKIYVKAGKRLVAAVQPILSRFLTHLRCQYGQFWIRELGHWDSRRDSLGGYCTSLQLRWLDPSQSKYYWFLPTPASHTIAVTPGNFTEYLTEADWRRLQNSRCLEEPNLATVLLGQATESLAQEDYLQAYVAATCALEIAISTRLTADEEQEPKLAAALRTFFDRNGVTVQTGVILRALGISATDIERLLEIVEVRNKAVHEGHRITWKEAELLRPMMKIVSQVLGLDAFKSPRLSSGNSLAAPPKQV